MGNCGSPCFLMASSRYIFAIEGTEIALNEMKLHNFYMEYNEEKCTLKVWDCELRKPADTAE